MDISQIRQEYTKRKFNPDELTTNPMVLFEKWLSEAIADKKVLEPTAVVVGTVGEDGMPSTRTVLLKEVWDGKFVFYTNYESRKGRQIVVNPRVSLTFLWHEFQRQVHVEGTVEKAPAEMSDAYFQKRPYQTRVGARISHQSMPIPGRMFLMREFVKEAWHFKGQEVPRPDYWGGYVVSPVRIEFWQGRLNRLHDRFLYELCPDGSWSRNRLSP